MSKRLIVGATVVGVGVVLVARECASRCGSFDFEQMIERMPDNAPPKWMFNNISAIRENTERILRLLDGAPESAAHEPARTAA